MSRSWKLCSLLLAVGCASRGGPAFETVTTLPDEPRVPAGAEVERTTSLPAPSDDAETGDGLVVLRAPIDPRLARATVEGFFRALLEESPSSLDTVLAPDAVVQVGSRREPARGYYVGRFVRLDYRSLHGETLYRSADVETWDGGGRSTSGASAPLAPRADEIVVQVHIIVVWGGRPRVFGDDLVFRLKPRGTGFVIQEIVEDFRPT